MTKPDDDDPIAALTGEPSLPLSREGKAMERLQGWLERPLWSGARNPVGPLAWPEGVCILAGIDPEASADADAAGWALLPGALTFYGFSSFPRDRHERMQLLVTAEEHIGLLTGLGLKTAPPSRWIDRVQREGIPIPWQEARMRAAQSARRRGQHETEDAVKLLNDEGRTAFIAARDSSFEGLRTKSGRPHQGKIAKEVTEAMQAIVGEDAPESEILKFDTVRKYVAAWLKEVGT
ncbi:hypothetical protein [Paenirhodobacter sp.]|uniref:hypothetical protein n=1 Tax=Paenirhodobacter sp. TaxID=1965326 RepID=UPI003B3C3ABC